MTTSAPELIAVPTHPFERAGLGKAPFRYVGSYESKYQAVPGDPSCPIQPGSSCDYCGIGIMLVCRILSADGKEFKVGCDCVTRTAMRKDDPLVKMIDKAKAAHTKKAKAARDKTKLEELAALMADEQKRTALAAKPHPLAYRAEKGETMLDWAEWMHNRSGMAGMIRLLKTLKAA